MHEETLHALIDSRRSRRPVAVLTWLETGEQRLVRRGDTIGTTLDEALANAVRGDRSQTVATDAGEVFIHVFNPPLRLLIVGAVHAAQTLAPMAAMLDYEVTVLDPRTGFATAERFPHTSLVTAWPDEAMPAFAPDARTAVVALTHDPKIDDPALLFALGSEAFYIGALGSSRTHANRVARLTDMGVPERALARIHAPIGLDIGSRGPAEIALSILGEMTAVLRGKVTSSSAPAGSPA